MSRLSVALYAAVQLLVGIIYTALSIVAANALNQVLDEVPRMGIFLHIFVYALLILVSLLGIFGVVKQKRKLVSSYWSFTLVHVIFAIASGALLFSFLFKKSTDEDQAKCEPLQPSIVQELCYRTLKVKAVSVTFLVLNWIIEIAGLCIINSYCTDLGQEEVARVAKATFDDEETRW